jgi:hypothetical protein
VMGDCSFCDAVFWSGSWIATDSVAPVWRCPDCGDGWNPMAGAAPTVSTSAG